MGVGPGQRGAGPTPAGLRVPGMSGPAAAGGRRPRRRGSACGAAAQLPFWFFDCGRRSAARKATACADASGPRGRELIPENAPLRVTGKTSRPNLALHGPYTGPYLCHQKANKNRWQQHEEKSAQ